MEYFDHDTTASSDDAIMAIRLEHGGAAVDCYWAIIEKIFRDESPLSVDENQPETKALTHRLAIGLDSFSEYVKTMVSVGLLEVVGNDPLTVMSARARAKIEWMDEKHKTAVENGKKGGRPKGSKTKTKPNQNQSQTKKNHTKTYTGMESYTLSNTNAGADADAEGSASRPSGKAAPQAVFAEADKAVRDTVAAQAQRERWESEAVPCPADVAQSWGVA